MATQLKINLATSPVSIKEMSGTELDYSVNKILTAFIANDTDIGSIQVNPANTTGLTLIGSFTDTYIPSTPGTHPIGTTPTSTTYNFYQNQGSAAESLVRPVEYSSGIQEQTDTSLNGAIIARSLANLVSAGIGSYQLNPTAPVGGTWVSKATITNNLDNTTSNVTYLWKKTAEASTPSVVLPLKINTATTPKSLIEMSDAEIQTLANRVKNQLVSTGIGTCKVQSAAPVTGGTWVTEGSQFLDTTRTTSNIAYSGAYTGTYTGVYTGYYSGTYSGPYTGFYSGTYSGNYTGAYTIYYAGRAGGTTNHTYTGFYTGAYTGYYTGYYTGTYAGNYSGSYTGYYTGYYTGTTLNNDSSTVSSVYLWVRTA